MYKTKTYTGKFRPKNPEKYKGDPTKIIYRSLWERRLMKYLDDNSNVLEWQSEEFWVPYISPLDAKPHRYFPDFLAKMRKKDGTVQTLLLEVKPKAQVAPPQKKSKITQSYLNEIATWGVNQAKWESAKRYCEKNGWEFRLITEVELGIK